MILHDNLLLRSILSDDAEYFVAQCRRESRMFPRRHIDEVVREPVQRIVSRDFISGSCDSAFSNEGLSVLLIRQAG